MQSYVSYIEWHYYRWSLVILKVTFAVRDLSVSQYSGNAVCIIYGMLTRELEIARGL